VKKEKKPEDVRIQQVRELFEVGAVKNFDLIFKFLPKTVLAKALRTPPETLTRKLQNRYQFELQDIKYLADLFNVPFKTMLDLIAGDMR
jgi:hypothetical protein